MSKVALICYACSPYQGSEAGVGWGILSNLAKEMEVIAFVESEKFEQDLQKYLSDFPRSSVALNVEFVFVKKKRGRTLRKIWPPSYYWFYRRWHRNVFTILKDKVERNEVSLIHQITMVGFREPGYGWKLNVPFVIGPVGGLGFVRLSDFKYFDLYGKIYYFCFNIVNFIQTFLSQRPLAAWLKAIQKTNGIIAADFINARYIQRMIGENPIIFPEVGPPDCKPDSRNSILKADRLCLVWVGNIENRKGLIILLNALKDLDRPYKLDVFGDGPLMTKMIWFSKINCLNVQFHGQKPRAFVLDQLINFDLLIFTSLRDLSATVTIEANTCGLPVVCFNRGGFAQWLCSENNYILDGNSNLVSLLGSFLENYDYQNGRVNKDFKVNELFSWRNKVQILKKIYANKLN